MTAKLNADGLVPVTLRKLPSPTTKLRVIRTVPFQATSKAPPPVHDKASPSLSASSGDPTVMFTDPGPHGSDLTSPTISAAAMAHMSARMPVGLWFGAFSDAQ